MRTRPLCFVCLLIILLQGGLLLMTKYKSIDLFAGIGGIRLGFDRAFKNNNTE